MLITLLDAYYEEKLEGGQQRIVLRFDPKIAPYRVAVLPLMKKSGLTEIALQLKRELEDEYHVFYDQQGSIGKRYRRMDEIGTPFCITVDTETPNDQCVTLRFRDSMEQQRVKLSAISSVIREQSQRNQAMA